MVGRIQNVRTNIKSIKNDVEKVITKFDLTDGRYTVPVTLFDDFGVQFAEELEDCKQTEIYIIIAAAKVGLYEGIANLTNYPATRIYINPTHYSIGELKAKMLETIEETVSSPPQEITELKTLTIKEIKAMTPDSTECRVKCQLKVTKVEEQSSWFYAVCTKCPKEISRVDGVFKCEDCNRIIPYPDKRFRICTLCSDNTGSIAVIFLDQEVTRIIEKTVFDIEVDAIQENTEGKFPAVLKTFEKKVYTITLNITENNLKKGSMVYEADEIFDKIESTANFDPSTNTDTQMVEAATVDLKDDDLSTPTTGISSTKTRARVDIEPVAFDPKEDTPAKLNKKDKKKKIRLSLYIPHAINCEKTASKGKMSSRYAALANLKTGVDNYKIKVRVIRKWRGATKTGEEFKNFNILLLDNKDYKKTDKFRVVRRDNQLIFTTDTKIQQIEETAAQIATEIFDFYDLSELKNYMTETTYVIDVVGVIKDHKILLEQITNRHGIQQEQAKFVISDGRTNVNVTFWDKYAQVFVEAIWKKMETPVIIILAGCRVQMWSNAPNVTHVAPTTFYLNLNHHSVNQLRRMLAIPDFSKKVMAMEKKKKAELLTVEAIKSLDKDSVEAEVLAHVTIMHVDDQQKWFFKICTSCDFEVDFVNEFYSCARCQRIVPYPEIRFRLVVIALDATGSLQILLEDREVRSLLGKRARQLIPQEATEEYFPESFKMLATQTFTIKMEIHAANVLKQSNLYWATNICHGFKLEEMDTEMEQQPQSQSINTQATTSTAHLPGMSDLNCNSSAVTN
ncbi:hypothetical protein DCAR_0101045 [Daucus carota subsp. sativus]|uniref:Replication factor A C-terminal domain-containing protein n=2 Tax=Daucus carota subsp. sativus TaxID=79200 RepID=A0AAF0W2C7_DAUCS|nr:hypothetical protein DCAR_0101045 [Daucus carota subsp. sativus]